MLTHGIGSVLQVPPTSSLSLSPRQPISMKSSIYYKKNSNLNILTSELVEAIHTSISRLLSSSKTLSAETVAGIMEGLGNLGCRWQSMTSLHRETVRSLVASPSLYSSRQAAQTLCGLAMLQVPLDQIDCTDIISTHSQTATQGQSLLSALYRTGQLDTDDFSSMLRSLSQLASTNAAPAAQPISIVLRGSASSGAFSDALVRFLSSPCLSVKSLAFAIKGLSGIGMTWQAFDERLRLELINAVSRCVADIDSDNAEEGGAKYMALLFLAITDFNIPSREVDSVGLRIYRQTLLPALVKHAQAFDARDIVQVFIGIKKSCFEFSSSDDFLFLNAMVC